MSTVNTVSYILTKVSSLQGVQNAYDYEKGITDTTGFPMATVTLKDGLARFLTTAHNERTNNYFIRIYQEKSQPGVGASNAEKYSRQVLDEILTAFDMDTTLSGTVKYARPIQWNAGYVERELDARILEVTVETVEIVSSL